MLFNDPVFLFGFMPATLGLVGMVLRLSGRRAAIVALIFASLFFYGWWKVTGLVVIASSILCNLALALALQNFKLKPRSRSWFLGVGIGLNLFVLGYFKYMNFFLENLDAVGVSIPAQHVILPIGLSFYTFQQIAFLVDTFNNEIGRLSPLEYIASVLFFPHLIAGPLVQYRHIITQFKSGPVITRKVLLLGTAIFITGLAKKVVIADNLAVYVTPLYAKAQNGVLEMVSAWVAAVGYTAQIYFDFSGYSDMAIGLGLMFGITLPVNFYSPYKATSVIEFWRRWHITLSEFLRNYLYFPLGGNRKGAIWRYVNLAIVMLLGGLWHGAAWTFVFWGALHGSYLVANHAWRNMVAPRIGSYNRRLRPAFAVLTFLSVVVAWVFFRASDFRTATNVLWGMVGMAGIALPPSLAYIGWPFSWPLQEGGMTYPDVFIAPLLILLSFGIAWAAPNTAEIYCLERGHGATNSALSIRYPYAMGFGRTVHWSIVGALVWLCLLSIIGSVPSEFLYFQF